MVEDVARDGKFVDPVTDSLTAMGAKLSRHCKKGTLTIVCSGTAKTVGQASFLKRDACIHDGFLAMTDIHEGFASEFIYYQIQKFQTQAERLATHGGTFINLTTSILKDFERAFPPIEEQEKVASFLAATDAALQQLSQKKAMLEDYKKGVMQQLFTQALRFKDDHGNDFPDWEEKTLGAIASFSKGCGISKAEVHEDGALPCIRYGELYTHYAELIRDVKSRTNVPEKDLVLSQRNDVIIPASGETHIDIATASCVTVDGVALGGDLNIIRTKQNGVFLAYYLNNACKHAIAGMAQGSSVIHLYPDQLKRLRLQLPSVSEQTKIANFLTALDRKIESVAHQITHTQTFKKGLLQQMFV
jgi:type I restriction enzyme S subunit